MNKYFNIIGFTIFFLFNLYSLNFAQEQIIVTTYYPSPYGNFQELRTNKMAVSPTRIMPADGNLAWGDYRGLLSPDQGASIELGGDTQNPYPYIDFSNDNTANNYDARISLLNDNTLRIYVDNVVVIKNKAGSNWADISVKCMKYNSFLINPSSGVGDICPANLDVINP